MARKPKAILKIILDTNAVISTAPARCISAEMEELITALSNDIDFSVEWFLPRMVVHERRYRMLQRARGLRGHITQLEAVLGRSLVLPDSLLEEAIDARIKDQLSKLSIVVLELATTKVDWERVMRDAVYRVAPFDPREEKGFRDAIIGETIAQLVDSLDDPLSIVVVTGDGKLTEMIKSRVGSRGGVQIVESAEALQGLIRERRAGIDAEAAAAMRNKAQTFFYESGEHSLWQKANVLEMIVSEARNELFAIPPGSDRREVDGITVGTSEFLKRHGARTWWTNRFRAKSSTWKREIDYSSLMGMLPSGQSSVSGMAGPASGAAATGLGWGTPWSQPWGGSPGATGFGVTYPPAWPGGLGVPPGGVQEMKFKERCLARGETVVDVEWSAVEALDGNLSEGKVEKITVKGTVWES